MEEVKVREKLDFISRQLEELNKRLDRQDEMRQDIIEGITILLTCELHNSCREEGKGFNKAEAYKRETLSFFVDSLADKYMRNKADTKNGSGVAENEDSGVRVVAMSMEDVPAELKKFLDEAFRQNK